MSDDAKRRVDLMPLGKDDAVLMFLAECDSEKSPRRLGKRSIELLKMNFETTFARYAVFGGEDDGDPFVVALVDHLLDTLDPKEFRANVRCVALAAEAYDERFG